MCQPCIESATALSDKTYYMSQNGIWRVLSRIALHFYEPKGSAFTAYE